MFAKQWTSQHDLGLRIVSGIYGLSQPSVLLLYILHTGTHAFPRGSMIVSALKLAVYYNPIAINFDLPFYLIAALA